MIYSPQNEADDWFVGLLNGEQPEDTLMQFTGLLDKNGKEIYFDDFVHIIGKSSTVGDVDTIVRIEDWYNVVGEFGLEDAIEGGLTLEVIGNVWENPELLK